VYAVVNPDKLAEKGPVTLSDAGSSPV